MAATHPEPSSQGVITCNVVTKVGGSMTIALAELPGALSTLGTSILTCPMQFLQNEPNSYMYNGFIGIVYVYVGRHLTPGTAKTV